jgi:hypothetical protein
MKIQGHSQIFQILKNVQMPAKLNRVNISCENGTPKSFFVLRYKQLKYLFMDTFIKIKIART